MKKDELNAVAFLYILIICLGWWTYTSVQQSNQIKKLHSKLDTQKISNKILSMENDALHEGLQSINEAYDEQAKAIEDLQVLIQIRRELRNYTLEEQALGLALSWTESTWNPDAEHNSDAVGKCGVIPYYWKEYLHSRNVKVNSVAACIEIYKFYKEANSGSRYKAIKDYKGIKAKSNEYLILHTLKLRDKVLAILKRKQKWVKKYLKILK